MDKKQQDGQQHPIEVYNMVFPKHLVVSFIKFARKVIFFYSFLQEKNYFSEKKKEKDGKNAIIKCPLSTIISKKALNTLREGRVVVGHVLDVSPLPSS